MKKVNLHSCNILDAGTEDQHLWQFNLGNDRTSLNTEQSVPPVGPLPGALVAKDWRTLWQQKLNIAWLPADQVFLRVIQLPSADFSELVSMVEFQLEKLSPLPVNQIVWSVEPLPKQPEQSQQTLIVIIIARNLVEEFLGVLEARGYLPDRLELPQLHQLLATQADGNGVWIYPDSSEDKDLCLVAWWFGGVLQQLQLVHLPSGSEQGAVLIEQLTKTAWAGEVEGWIVHPFKWVLVANPETIAVWQQVLQQWTGTPIEVVEPLPQGTLEEGAARRAARGETKTNLLPPEYSVRYRQQFIDRLWMSGLAAVIVTYSIGVMIYFIALQVISYQERSLEKRVAGLSGSYTNAVRMSERIDVLQDQLNLKFAALDSLRIASELLPPDLTLVHYAFDRGQKLTLEGTAPQDQVNELIEYNDALRKSVVEGQVMFKAIEQPKWEMRGQNIAWRFTCELNRAQTE